MGRIPGAPQRLAPRWTSDEPALPMTEETELTRNESVFTELPRGYTLVHQRRRRARRSDMYFVGKAISSPLARRGAVKLLASPRVRRGAVRLAKSPRVRRRAIRLAKSPRVRGLLLKQAARRLLGR